MSLPKLLQTSEEVVLGCLRSLLVSIDAWHVHKLLCQIGRLHIWPHRWLCRQLQSFQQLEHRVHSHGTVQRQPRWPMYTGRHYMLQDHKQKHIDKKNAYIPPIQAPIPQLHRYDLQKDDHEEDYSKDNHEENYSSDMRISISKPVNSTAGEISWIASTSTKIAFIAVMWRQWGNCFSKSWKGTSMCEQSESTSSALAGSQEHQYNHSASPAKDFAQRLTKTKPWGYIRNHHELNGSNSK